MWRGRLRSGSGVNQNLASWLTEPGSLTARCQAHSRAFQVRLLHLGYGRPLADEQAGRAKRLVREVLLECDGIPVIFAHTTLSTAVGGQLSRWLARLGSRSLGSLLFAHPGFMRGRIEYCRLDARHPLFQRVVGLSQPMKYLWARRSWHHLGVQAVLVTEVFLPAIEQLAGGREDALAIQQRKCR